MKAFAEGCLENGFADPNEPVAYLNNAAMLLRLCERHSESEALLVRGLAVVGDEPQLNRAAGAFALGPRIENKMRRRRSTMTAILRTG